MRETNIVNERLNEANIVEERAKPKISKRALAIIIVAVVFALITYAIPIIYVKVLEYRIGSVKSELTSRK